MTQFKIKDVVFAPASKEQENFLNCDNVDFAFYGGELSASVQNLVNSVKP